MTEKRRKDGPFRRCYCIACGQLHRRNPATWTGKGCTFCGAEVRFTSPPLYRTLRLHVTIATEDLELLGSKPTARLEEALRDHVTAIRRKALRDADIAAPITVRIDNEAPPVRARIGRPRRGTVRE